MIHVNLINDLIYRSYMHNRDRFPHITPDRWRLVYGAAVDEFERRYQDELAAAEWTAHGPGYGEE